MTGAAPNGLIASTSGFFSSERLRRSISYGMPSSSATKTIREERLSGMWTIRSTRYRPTCFASASRWCAESPNKSSLAFARLKYRCGAASQVNPMPPWIWMLSAAAW